MIDTKRIVNNKKNTPLDIISQYDQTSNFRLLRLETETLDLIVRLCRSGTSGHIKKLLDVIV
jgi:hypothetical protein